MCMPWAMNVNVYSGPWARISSEVNQHGCIAINRATLIYISYESDHIHLTHLCEQYKYEHVIYNVSFNSVQTIFLKIYCIYIPQFT